MSYVLSELFPLQENGYVSTTLGIIKGALGESLPQCLLWNKRQISM